MAYLSDLKTIFRNSHKMNFPKIFKLFLINPFWALRILIVIILFCVFCPELAFWLPLFPLFCGLVDCVWFDLFWVLWRFSDDWLDLFCCGFCCVDDWSFSFGLSLEFELSCLVFFLSSVLVLLLSFLLFVDFVSPEFEL